MTPASFKSLLDSQYPGRLPAHQRQVKLVFDQLLANPPEEAALSLSPRNHHQFKSLDLDIILRSTIKGSNTDWVYKWLCGVFGPDNVALKITAFNAPHQPIMEVTFLGFTVDIALLRISYNHLVLYAQKPA